MERLGDSLGQELRRFGTTGSMPADRGGLARRRRR